MDTFANDDLRELLVDRPGPCVSLYAPTHRGGSGQDLIRWRNVLADAGQKLAAVGLRTPEATAILAPAARLLDDPSFWHATAAGLVCFLAPGFDRRYRLGMTWPGRATVGGQFLVKPLLPWLNGGTFYVLALSQNAVRLVRGTPHGAAAVALPGGRSLSTRSLPPTTGTSR